MLYHVLERYSYIAASSWGISDAPATGQFVKYQTWLMVMTIEKDFTHKEDGAGEDDVVDKPTC